MNEIRDEEVWRGNCGRCTDSVGCGNHCRHRCVSSGKEAGPKLKTYEIGYQGPLSGGNAATGLYEKYGAQLAVKQWDANKKRKFNIKLVPGDDQGDPTIAPPLRPDSF